MGNTKHIENMAMVNYNIQSGNVLEWLNRMVLSQKYVAKLINLAYNFGIPNF